MSLVSNELAAGKKTKKPGGAVNFKVVPSIYKWLVDKFISTELVHHFGSLTRIHGPVSVVYFLPDASILHSHSCVVLSHLTT